MNLFNKFSSRHLGDVIIIWLVICMCVSVCLWVYRLSAKIATIMLGKNIGGSMCCNIFWVDRSTSTWNVHKLNFAKKFPRIQHQSNFHLNKSNRKKKRLYTWYLHRKSGSFSCDDIILLILLSRQFMQSVDQLERMQKHLWALLWGISFCLKNISEIFFETYLSFLCRDFSRRILYRYLYRHIIITSYNALHCTIWMRWSIETNLALF